MTITCPKCQRKRIVKADRTTDLCRECNSEAAAKALGLPDGNWRLNPFTRLQEWVPEGPPGPDAFDEPVIVKKPSPPSIARKPGPKPGPINHGTESGYKQHLRRRIPCCIPCREAATEKSRERRQAQTAATKKSNTNRRNAA